ncbi:LysR family substrate-binding domain-containing protein [Gordonia alkaliphila]|uniref:LysR family substrate-binding domain-containing protein n=2 Tax=Gordonia alkaliphila TaxID=1053547 RepID=A0ABP8YXS3_9ACTN
MTAEESAQVFRLAYVPGVMPAKWVRVFEERRPGVAVELVDCPAADVARRLRAGLVDAALARPDVGDVDGLSVIRLYDEVPVAVVPKDHVFTAVDEVAAADLAGEQYLLPDDDVLGWTGNPGTVIEHRPETTAAAVELVAAGLGVLVVPMSLARLHHRRDLTYRPLADGPAASVGLLWVAAAGDAPTPELVEEFIGVVRGRRPGSSRGQSEPAPKRSAKEKAAARRASLEASGKVPPRPAKGGKSSGRSQPSKGRRRTGR